MNRPQLHVLTDPLLARGRSPVDVARAALAGGADVIQLRDKTRTAQELEEPGRELARVVREAGALLVVNDHVELALRLDADGVHLGPDDLPPARARERWAGWLGVSARSVDTARSAVEAGADYLGVGPVFATGTKEDAPAPIGLEGLARVAAAVAVPVIGIGGVRAANAADVVRAGAAGVAVISGALATDHVRAAVRALREALDGGPGRLAGRRPRC